MFSPTRHPGIAESITFTEGRWENFQTLPFFDSSSFLMRRMKQGFVGWILLLIFHTFFYSFWLFGLLMRRHRDSLYCGSDCNNRLLYHSSALFWCSLQLCTVCMCLPTLLSDTWRMLFTVTSHLVVQRRRNLVILWSSDFEMLKKYFKTHVTAKVITVFPFFYLCVSQAISLFFLAVV